MRIRGITFLLVVALVAATAPPGSAASTTPPATEPSASAGAERSAAAGGEGSRYVAVIPCRVVDTRTPGSGGALRSMEYRAVQITGTCRIPTDATAVQLTTTPITPSAQGFLRMWPSGGPEPTATVATYQRGQTTTSSASIPLSSDGRITTRSHRGDLHLAIDVHGYFTETEPGATFVPVAPCRILDTRHPGYAQGRLRGTGNRLWVTGDNPSAAGQGGRAGGCGIPHDAVAVQLTFTPITPSAQGFLRSWKSYLTEPVATVVTYQRGQSTTNSAILALPSIDEYFPDLGDLTVRNHRGELHLAVDVQGYFTHTEPGAAFVPVTPCRVVDTRTSSAPGGRLRSMEYRAVQVTGSCGIPTDATAVRLTATPITPSAQGFLRMWPSGGPEPTATVATYQRGQTTTSSASVPLSADGRLTTRSHRGDSHLAIDVQGYWREPDPLTGATQVSAGLLHTCTVVDGSVRCWGSIFDPDSLTFVDESTLPFVVPGLTDIRTVSGGASHTCAATDQGTVWCWGDNTYGQLGIGRPRPNTWRPSIPVPDLTDVAEVEAGAAHTCALHDDGLVSCWGENWAGQLGDGTTTDRHRPVPVAGLADVTSLAVGHAFTCASKTDGTVWCWGSNEASSLGIGERSFDPVPEPVQVIGLTDAAQVAAGDAHVCARLENSTIRCWGYNDHGQLGIVDPQLIESGTPLVVGSLDGATDLAAGTDHTCAVIDDGTIRCWGSNESGQLGDGTTTVRTSPVQVYGMIDARQVALGLEFTCAVLADETIDCWGWNGAGQLGNGTIDDSYLPVPVLSHQVSAGG